MVLDKNITAFVVNISSLNPNKPIMSIHLTKKTQLIMLIAKKIKISVKYLDFSDFFLEKRVLVIPEIIELN